MSKIIKRIVACLKIPDIINVLGSIPTTDLQSLLLEIYRAKTNKLKIKEVNQQSLNNRFVLPSTVDQRNIVAFDNLAYEILPQKFEAVELSPVAPLGINKTLGGIDQNNVVTAIRNIEVMADPTSALALLCAQKRNIILKKERKSADRISLATSHRILRGQCFDGIDGFTPHFRVLALATAGRDVGFERFEKEVIIEHIAFYLSLLEGLEKTNKYYMRNVVVSLSDIRITEHLIKMFHMDRKKIGLNTQNSLYSIFNEYKIDLPKTISFMKDLPQKAVDNYDLEKLLTMLLISEHSIVNALKQRFPKINFNFDIERTAGMGYYSNLCFKITAVNHTGDKFPLVDGGMSQWTQKILNSKKERYFSSGIGSEILCNLFSKP